MIVVEANPDEVNRAVAIRAIDNTRANFFTIFKSSSSTKIIYLCNDSTIEKSVNNQLNKFCSAARNFIGKRSDIFEKIRNKNILNKE
ncbi:hypothetical protein [Cloacibacillus porcorum]|uniref:hypothetical protein n=1 Tax=Cloacibacillus porcorum TaxID=1197717 RepID=UPI002A825E12|nr:hypothetical protein [Cloacibacillus porcorum]MDD7649634.1 hypothetical protein [Cloacibacillus porcorum]MDY4092514.1 hypothetical protein [Cloacibacillus porcorum]